MLFPSTGVLDNCTRANESPLSDGGNWLQATPFDSHDLQLASNAITTITLVTGNFACRYWNPSVFGPAMEAWAVIGTKGTNTNDQVNLFLHVDSSDLSNFPSMSLTVTRNTAGTDSWQFLRYAVADQDHAIGPAVLQNLNNGDSFGMSCIGFNYFAWYKPSGGAWQILFSIADSVYAGLKGKIALEMGNGGSGASYMVTSFGGGTMTDTPVIGSSKGQAPYPKGFQLDDTSGLLLASALTPPAGYGFSGYPKNPLRERARGLS